MKNRFILGFFALFLSAIAHSKVVTYDVVLSGTLNGDSSIFGITGDASGDYSIYGEISIFETSDSVTGTEGWLTDMSIDVAGFEIDESGLYESFFDFDGTDIQEYFVETEQCKGCGSGDTISVSLVLNNKYSGWSGFSLTAWDLVSGESESLSGDVSFTLQTAAVSEPHAAFIFSGALMLLFAVRRRRV